MIRNASVVDVFCQGEGEVNDANEVQTVEVRKFANVPGRLRALRGRELETAQQIRANIAWRFDCRQPGIEPEMWICEQGRNRLLNVEVSLPDERHTEFAVLCSERV